jgi:hypothetical protein
MPMPDDDLFVEKYLASMELTSKADQQLAGYYEKLIVLGAGGIAGGASIAASLAVKLGKLSGSQLLIESLSLMGIATVCSIFAHSFSSASSIMDLHLVALKKADLGEIELWSKERARRAAAHPLLEKLNRLLGRIGANSSGVKARIRKVIFSVLVALALANGFALYVIFIIENVLRFPHY